MFIRDGDLAVEHDRPTVRDEALEWLAKQRRAIMTIATEQPELAATRNDCNQPMAVVLDLMQPAFAIRRLSAWGYDLEADIGRQIGRDRAWGKTERHSR